MANQPETNDSSLFPESFPLAPDPIVGGPDVSTGTGTSEEPTSTREDSGLLDLLSVGAKIKEADDDDPIEPQSQREDSGLILFTAGDFGTAPSEGTADAARLADDDDGMFGSFAGGIGGGFGNLSEPNIGDDLTPMGGAGSVAESRPAEVRPAAVEEPKRNPLTALAVVLGLAVVAAGAVYLTDKEQPKPQQAQAEMTAKPIDDAAVGKAEPDPVDPVEANSGAAPIPEPVPELEPEAETEGALDPDGLLAAADTSADDPMAQKDALLSGSGTKPGGKTGKWEQGEPQAGTSTGGAVVDDPDPDPDPDPIADPKPVEGGKKPPGPANDDEVDCLLNPDLDKCTGGGGGGGGGGEVLAPKIPEKLDSGQLRDGFNTVKSKAKACGSKFGAEPGTKVKVHASIEGATGKVTAVSAQGDHAGTDLGKCVEDVVKDATFSAFKKPSQGVDYSMIM